MKYMKKNEFIEACEKARQLQKEMDAVIYDIFDNLPEEACDISTNAKNTENVEEAIYNFIHYGQYNPKSIWEEINNHLSEE